MASARLQKREVPWCAFFLILASISCHVCVLVGNLKTASAMEDLGASTSGWSNVGLGLSRSLHIELDYLMSEVTTRMVEGLQNISGVQLMLDTVLSLAGNTTDAAVSNTAQVAMLQQGNTTEAMEGLKDMIMNAVDQVLHNAFGALTHALDQLLLTIKPALTQIGEWMLTFGSKITAGIEAFGTSLDRVQKIFDQVMEQLNGRGEGEDDLLHETFTLFDVSNTGHVTIGDLREVAELYAISALQGTKPEELVVKYDGNGDSQLNNEEMRLLVNDESVPNVMAVVLRTYARKLSEVAGSLKDAKMRDEVAERVVNYFQLVCAKNQTKVGWVSDALSNGSLPLDFTAAVYAQLCLSEHDPNVLTTADVGGMVITRMYSLHADVTVEALDRMSDATYWVENGFNPFDQPRCVERVTRWMVEAQQAFANATAANAAYASSGGGARTLALLDREVLLAMPRQAHVTAEAHMQRYLMEKQRKRSAQRAALFSSATSQALLLRLTGGAAAMDATNPNAERAINAGQPAKPETLRFAQWLRNNATDTAQEFQGKCFNYSSQSSSALDSFATQIQGLVKKVQSFIQMMEKWATPAGIQRLENTVRNFVVSAEADVMAIVQEQLGAMVDSALPAAEAAIDEAASHVADEIGQQVGDKLGEPIGRALEGPIGAVAGQVLDNPEVGEQVGQQLGPLLGDAIANQTSEVISQKLGDVLDDLIEKALEGAAAGLQHSTGQLALRASLLESAGPGP